MYRTNFMTAGEDQVFIKDYFEKCAKLVVDPSAESERLI